MSSFPVPCRPAGAQHDSAARLIANPDLLLLDDDGLAPLQACAQMRFLILTLQARFLARLSTCVGSPALTCVLLYACRAAAWILTA